MEKAGEYLTKLVLKKVACTDAHVAGKKSLMVVTILRRKVKRSD